jgi:hypothetical protein
MTFVHIIDPERQRQTLQLLAEGFADSGINWPLVFNAPSGITGHGLLFIADGNPQGVILSFEKIVAIDGQLRRQINLSSWYIRPPYRRFAVRMMREATADPDTVYMICSPSPSVQKICLRTGFRYLSRGSVASVPLLNGGISRRVSSIEPFATPMLSGADHDRWMADHGDERYIGVVIRTGTSTVPVLWLRGLKVRGLPAARLLFTANYGILREALPAIHCYLLRHDGIAGLYLPRVGPLAQLRSVRRYQSGPSVMVKGEIDPELVNLLYSEFLYLHAQK